MATVPATLLAQSRSMAVLRQQEEPGIASPAIGASSGDLLWTANDVESNLISHIYAGEHEILTVGRRSNRQHCKTWAANLWWGMVAMREASQPPMRTLLVDNHDSYTFNLYQLIAQVNGGAMSFAGPPPPPPYPPH